MEGGRQRFPGRPEQVGRARRFVARAFAASQSKGVAELLVSEAVTNALLHSASGRPNGSFEVRYARQGRVIRVEVADAGAIGAPKRRVHAPDSVTGRGLDLFDALASRWGVDGGQDGRVVWFELEVESGKVRDEADGGAVRPSSAHPQPRPLRGGPPRGSAAGIAA